MMSKMKSVLKHKASELETLLQTADAKEQINRIQQLMRPTLTLAITLDARTGQISLTNVGAEIPAVVAHQMLDAARTALVRMEAKAETPIASPAAVAPSVEGKEG